MATTVATVEWDFVPGSLNTLVEYKPSSTSTWITPTSPLNPTPGNTYPLTLTIGDQYDVRLTTNGATCGPTSTTIQTTAQGSVFQVIDAVMGYEISRYWFDFSADSLRDSVSPKIACWIAYQAIGNGIIDFVLHDSTNVLTDYTVGGIVISNITAANGVNSSLATMPAGGYNQIIFKSSIDGGVTFTNLCVFNISTNLSVIQGTVENNGNAASQSSQTFTANEQFQNVFEFGGGVSPATLGFTNHRIGKFNGGLTNLPASGTLSPSTNIPLLGTFTGSLVSPPATITTGDTLNLAIDYNVTLHLVSGDFFADVAESIALGLRALGVGTFTGSAGSFVQPITAT